MINIAEILKNSPIGTKLYSPICGDVYLEEASRKTIVLTSKQGKDVIFDIYGRYYTYTDNYRDGGECLLFPSKDNRDWNTFQALCQFKPFDKIVGRYSNGFWTADFFSYYKPGNEDVLPFHGVSGYYYQCLPYNEETAKLIGTKDEYNG